MLDATNTKLIFGFVPAVCGFQQFVVSASIYVLKVNTGHTRTV